MNKKNRQLWLSLLVAAVIIVGILAAAAIGGTAYFISRHVRAQVAEQDDAAQRFADARQRFAGQKPLIELRSDDDAVLNRDLIPKSGAGTRLETLRVLAYDTRGHKLVNVTIPFWLLRLAPSHKFSVLSRHDIDFDADRVHITVEDLERRGPGLILDQANRRGSQVLVWTE
jgi:hypothetical protein